MTIEAREFQSVSTTTAAIPHQFHNFVANKKGAERILGLELELPADAGEASNVMWRETGQDSA